MTVKIRVAIFKNVLSVRVNVKVIDNCWDYFRCHCWRSPRHDFSSTEIVSSFRILSVRLSSYQLSTYIPQKASRIRDQVIWRIGQASGVRGWSPFIIPLGELACPFSGPSQFASPTTKEKGISLRENYLIIDRHNIICYY